MDSLGVIADEDVNTNADVEVGMDAYVADDNDVITKEFNMSFGFQFRVRCCSAEMRFCLS
ncbi:unnamed protein product [Brassica rapa]|uniref:Uncharacterized protein n=1 Tax=Brassica campestris TaxID=3711 RepID=A0A3P5Z3F9_BRACM|nr:unnamed protein product [Brassica rapa]VDC66748.1 unnamed protein product [Brassica rapa]